MSGKLHRKPCRLDVIQDLEAKAREAHWRVLELSIICGVSRRTLDAWFRTRRGCTPKQWLRQQQTKFAAELLREGFPLKQVSSELGFAHPQHFMRAFKKATGLSPKAWLARAKSCDASGGGGEVTRLRVLVGKFH